MNNLFFDISGQPDKRAVILGHPLGTNSSVWDDITPQLNKYFRVIRWDLPGHGKSPAVSADITSLAADALVAALLAKCDQLDIKQFHYFGTSIGGMIGQQLLAEHSHRLLSATLANTGARIGSQDA